MESETQTSNSIAWAAGLFEGEGHFTCRQRPNRRAYLEVGLTTTDEDIAQRWAEILGSTIRPKRWRHNKPHWKPQWTVSCSGHKALLLAETLRPYLGLRRTERLNEILNMVSASQPAARACPCCSKTFTPAHFRTIQTYCTADCAHRAKYLRRKFGTDNITKAAELGYRISIRPEQRQACIHGHPFDEMNTRIYIRKNGMQERRCRTCARVDAKRTYTACKDPHRLTRTITA